MKKLTVFYVGWGERWPLATLADNGKTILFEYTAEAMQQQLELSPRMLKLRVAHQLLAAFFKEVDLVLTEIRGS